MIEVGQPAPDFTLADQNGVGVRLSNLRGTPVVLYFYPKDDTPGCTTEACAFRDAWADYEKAGTQIIGISPDKVSAHRKFADKYRLPFTLLADIEKNVCRAYGVWQEKTMYGKTRIGVVRSTVIVDAEGVVRHVFPKVKVAGHNEAVLAAVMAIKP